jgi:hypothetical protein
VTLSLIMDLVHLRLLAHIVGRHQLFMPTARIR